MSKKCPRCGSKKIIIDNYDFAYCITCEMYDMVKKFPEQTIFDQITQSEETLAVEFVEPYTRWGEDGYLETLWKSNFRELSGILFDTKEEAIAATVMEMKKMAE